MKVLVLLLVAFPSLTWAAESIEEMLGLRIPSRVSFASGSGTDEIRNTNLGGSFTVGQNWQILGHYSKSHSVTSGDTAADNHRLMVGLATDPLNDFSGDITLTGNMDEIRNYYHRNLGLHGQWFPRFISWMSMRAGIQADTITVQVDQNNILNLDAGSATYRWTGLDAQLTFYLGKRWNLMLGYQQFSMPSSMNGFNNALAPLVVPIEAVSYVQSLPLESKRLGLVWFLPGWRKGKPALGTTLQSTRTFDGSATGTVGLDFSFNITKRWSMRVNTLSSRLTSTSDTEDDSSKINRSAELEVAYSW